LRPDWQHTLISLAGLGAASALAWHGVIDGQSAVLIIGGVVGVNAAVNVSAASQKPPPPA
jgi:hypothetical protein